MGMKTIKDIEIVQDEDSVRAINDGRCIAGIRITRDNRLVVCALNVPDEIDELETVCESALKVIRIARERLENNNIETEKKAEKNPNLIRARFSKLCKWLEENTNDTGYKDGIKSTSYTHKFNGVFLNMWRADDESSRTLNIEAEILTLEQIGEHRVSSPPETPIVRIGNLYTSYVSKFNCDESLLEYAESRCYT